MNEPSNILNDLFSEARSAKPVVSFEESAAQVHEALLSQHPISSDTSTTLSNLVAKSGAWKVVVAGIAAMCAGLTFWGLLAMNSSEGDSEARVKSDRTTLAMGVEESRVESRGVESRELGVGSQEIGKVVSRVEREEKESVEEKRGEEGKDFDEHGLYAKPAPFVRGVRMLTLSDEELGRLGIVRDTAGVWSFNRENGKVFGTQVGLYGTEFIPPTAQRSMPTPSVVPEFQPVVITDDLGNSRVQVYEEGEEAPNFREIETSFRCWQVLDSTIQRKILLYFRSVSRQDVSPADTVLVIARTDKSNSTESLYRISIASKPGAELVGERSINWNLGEYVYDQILKKDYAYREIPAELYTRSLRLTTGNLIPILVQTGREFTEADKAAGRWRPDCIFWFKPTPEFLAALPEKARVSIERQLRFADLLEQKPDGESIETFIERQAPEIRSRFDSLSRDERTPEEEVSVAGEIYLDSWRAASGAITNSEVTPNPSRKGGEIFFRYHLANARSISLSLYNINGEYVRTFLEEGRRDGGEHLEILRLDDLTLGVYLLVVSTERGERVVQRLILQ
ncbi:MAG: T9SS type A sorting domain-containing protein [Candidatus Kapaibacterium sp.]